MKTRFIAVTFLSLVVTAIIAAGPSGTPDTPCTNCLENCSNLGWRITSSNPATLPSCGFTPYQWPMNWTWDVFVYGQSGATTTSDSPQSSGIGWCGGPTYGNCYNPQTGIAYPYNSPTNSQYPSSSNGWKWAWTDVVFSSLPGGKLPGGFGCAGVSSTSFTIALPAVTCKISPIIIDAQGEGFHLTDAEHGVPFREDNLAVPTQISWTDSKYHNGWLALPHNGQVRSLSDLFGNMTPQPPSKHPNGYRALAYFAYQSGCGTYEAPLKELTSKNCPAAWNQLRLWIDVNHNGLSEPNELRTLEEAGVQLISLEYRDSPLTDQYGNRFRYVSGIWDKAGPKENRCYDVFLNRKPDQP